MDLCVVHLNAISLKTRTKTVHQLSDLGNLTSLTKCDIWVVETNWLTYHFIHL